jgi:hypothetical protein
LLVEFGFNAHVGRVERIQMWQFLNEDVVAVT